MRCLLPRTLGHVNPSVRRPIGAVLLLRVSAPADLVFDPTLAHWDVCSGAATPSLLALSSARPHASHLTDGTTYF